MEYISNEEEKNLRSKKKKKKVRCSMNHYVACGLNSLIIMLFADTLFVFAFITICINNE